MDQDLGDVREEGRIVVLERPPGRGALPVDRRADRERRAAPLPVLAIDAGLGIGVKGTYIYALPGLALLWWLSERASGRAKEPPRFFADRARASAAFAARLAMVAMLAGSFCYARNALLFGNRRAPFSCSVALLRHSCARQVCQVVLTDVPVRH